MSPRLSIPLGTPRFRAALLVLSVLLVFLSAVTPARAQILKAKWVDESEERIDSIRKAPLRILVLDRQGDPIPDCLVHIQQLRHAFPFGLRLTPKALAAAPSKEEHDKAPLWRAFNAVALDAFTNWPATQPQRQRWQFDEVDKAIKWALERGMTVRWGSVVSSDPGRNPQWAAGLKGGELGKAVEAHARRVVRDYSSRVEQFDLLTQTLDRNDLEQQLGLPAIRRLHQLAEIDGQHKPQDPSRSQICLQLDDAFSGDRLSRALRRLIAVREAFVPVDALAIEVRLRGSIVEAPITRSILFVGEPGVPVVVTGLEVGGSTPTAAAINLETALRAMFSQPAIRGIYFSGLAAGELNDAEAALADAAGQPTVAGELVENLIRKLWWTDAKIRTDELGNVRHRVFAGGCRIRATLPGGEVLEAETFLPAGAREKLIVLQPATRAVATPAANAENR